MASFGNHWLCSISPKSSSAFRHCRAFPQASIMAAYEILPAVNCSITWTNSSQLSLLDPLVTNNLQNHKNNEGVKVPNYVGVLDRLFEKKNKATWNGTMNSLPWIRI